MSSKSMDDNRADNENGSANGDRNQQQEERPEESICFSGKTILAPMVRTSTLPMRLLSLRFGADIVYTEELIDYKLIRCQRVVNPVLGTVDYIDDQAVVVFRTCAEERDRLVLQLGTNDPQRALTAARLVAADVAAIDVNMGCPKSFSIKGGMGSALLTQPDKVYDILRTLVMGTGGKPITAKIRVLPSIEQTLSLVKVIESAGVTALAIHGRTQCERPKDPNRNHYIEAIARTATIPVIANGGSDEIGVHADIKRFRQSTGCSSVMIARAAQKNCSIFMARDELLPMDEVIKQYLELCIDYDNHVSNTKYVIQQMLGSLQDTDRGRTVLGAQSLRTICQLWHLDHYMDQRDGRKRDLSSSRVFTERTVVCNKRLKTRDESGDDHTKCEDMTEMDVIFVRSLYPTDSVLPKSRLNTYAKRRSVAPPVYETRQLDKHFHTVVSIDGRRYSSAYLEKNKRYAEQTAALVALLSLKLIHNSNEIDESVVAADDMYRISVAIDSHVYYIKTS